MKVPYPSYWRGRSQKVIKLYIKAEPLGYWSEEPTSPTRHTRLWRQPVISRQTNALFFRRCRVAVPGVPARQMVFGGSTPAPSAPAHYRWPHATQKDDVMQKEHEATLCFHAVCLDIWQTFDGKTSGISGPLLNSLLSLRNFFFKPGLSQEWSRTRQSPVICGLQSVFIIPRLRLAPFPADASVDLCMGAAQCG